MPNTLGGINISKVAQESLDFLALQLLPLRAFTRDFSKEILTNGVDVTTRVPTAVTAVDVSGGYTAQNVVSTAVTITVGTNKGFPFAFTDAEIQKAAGNPQWLQNVFMGPAIESVLAAMFADLMALVTAANFATTAVTSTASNFDADDVADMQGTLSTNKCPRTERSLIVKPTYHVAIQKDAIVQDASSYGGTDAIRAGKVPMIHGFDLMEYVSIPANAHNLEGFALHSSALCIAARPQVIPEDFPGQIENIIEPVTGLPLQFRYWYDATNKKRMMSVEALYGVAKGNGAGLVRIVSA